MFHKIAGSRETCCCWLIPTHYYTLYSLSIVMGCNLRWPALGKAETGHSISPQNGLSLDSFQPLPGKRSQEGFA